MQWCFKTSKCGYVFGFLCDNQAM